MTTDVEKVADALAARFREVAGPLVTMPQRAVWIGYAQAALAVMEREGGGG